MCVYIYGNIYHHHGTLHHGSPKPSLATRLYIPSLPVGLQGYILYRHRAVCISVLAVRPTFARPCELVHKSILLMSSPLLFQQCSTCLVHLILIISGWVVVDRTADALWGTASRTCSILLKTFLCNCRQAFSPYV